MTETGKAAYPLIADNATHAACALLSARPDREVHKASVEMDDKQKSAAIKSRRRGSCKGRGPETIIRL